VVTASYSDYEIEYDGSETSDSTGDSSNPVLNCGGVIDDGRLVNFTTLTPFFDGPKLPKLPNFQNFQTSIFKSILNFKSYQSRTAKSYRSLGASKKRRHCITINLSLDFQVQVEISLDR